RVQMISIRAASRGEQRNSGQHGRCRGRVGFILFSPTIRSDIVLRQRTGRVFGTFRELWPRAARQNRWRVVSDDDRRLIAECLGGRRDAFGELVTRYQARLYNAALRLVQSPDDAADVVQDSFLNAYQALHTFKGDAEFFTWLYRIAFNTATSLKRKKRPAVSLELQAGEAGLDPDDPSHYVKPGAALERTEGE